MYVELYVKCQLFLFACKKYKYKTNFRDNIKFSKTLSFGKRDAPCRLTEGDTYKQAVRRKSIAKLYIK